MIGIIHFPTLIRSVYVNRKVDMDVKYTAHAIQDLCEMRDIHNFELFDNAKIEHAPKLFMMAQLDGFGGVHGGMGFGTRNADGDRILEFGDAVGMVVCNTFFKKEDSKLITYQSGDNRSMIYYLKIRKTDRCLVKDVKVISSEECVCQHQMVIDRLVLPMKPQKKRIVKFVPKPRVWKLKDEDTARLFTHEMAARNDEVTKADDIQKKWLLMKETWLKGSKQVCGMTKGPPRHKETWWWNRDVEKVVAKRKVCHNAWRKSKSAEDKHTLEGSIHSCDDSPRVQVTRVHC